LLVGGVAPGLLDDRDEIEPAGEATHCSSGLEELTRDRVAWGVELNPDCDGVGAHARQPDVAVVL
jgi:hypothetical protein